MEISCYLSDLAIVPGVHLPIRSTVIPLAKGKLLISPIKFSPAQINEIQKGGEVTDIIAPNLIHNLHIEEATKNFPGATLWGTEGYPDKLPKIGWQKILGIAHWPYNDEVEIIKIEGAPKVNEFAFFHKPSKTLVVTDLCFNISEPKGMFAPMVFRLFGTFKKLAVSKMWNGYIKDKTAFQASVKRLLQWNFDRLIVAHGDIVQQNTRPALEQALREKKLI
ncbi:MAG: DUF4336 domain-containing protein [Bdellovibrionota bacterium]